MQFKTNQQSRQLKLAQKIARKLAQKNNASLTKEIRTNLNTLLTSIDILNQGWFNNDRQEGIILDESFQSAKNILASLKQYERILDQKNDENNYWLLITDYWLLITDYWLLITDYWLLITDYWLLITNYWLLITDY